MRTGIYSVQQALTAEAATTIKQAVNLARRRGHAQVTPLHVASAMLASSNGHLRRACLQSHSHPLQCKALELCFNVALNRLPASTSSALLGPQPSPPSLSNALVAAFKRAQAHQRRGSIENQQQPILALKIEMQQLIISILDDPSVGRVMREAGFSSSQVKNKVEQAVSISLEVGSQNQSSTQASSQSNSKESAKPWLVSPTSQSLPFSQFEAKLSNPLDQAARSDDVMSVLNALASKKSNIVITGECLANAESVVRGVMDKFERGHAPGDLRCARFVTFPLFSLRNLPKEELEQKLLELRCIIKSYMNRGVVLYLGDLKWVSDVWSTYGEQRRGYYCTVERIIMELKRLVRGIIDETGRFWLMGIATFQTYMKCKASNPSLEALWELHPITVPVGSLSLSLNLDIHSSEVKLESRSKEFASVPGWPLLESGVDSHSTCCIDYFDDFNKDSRSLTSSIYPNKAANTNITISTTSKLPPWLQQHKEQSQRNGIGDKQESINAGDLGKKWNSFCNSVPKWPCPPSSISTSSPEHNTSLNETQMELAWPVIFEPRQLPKENQIGMSESEYKSEGYDTKPDLLSNPNSSPNSASSSEAIDDMEALQSFKEFNADNLEILCTCLEKKVPWQRDIIPDIAATILECRSGIHKRKRSLTCQETREETWMFFSGVDSQGKERIAREIARLVFGSQSNFISIGLSNFLSARAESTEESKNKRPRVELGCDYYERFGLALNENPHRVFFMKDLDQVDPCSQKGIRDAIESGGARVAGGENVPLKDAIVIFSCEGFSPSVSSACTRPRRPKTAEIDHEDKDKVANLEEKSSGASFDLNIAIEVETSDGNSVVENEILEAVDKQIVFKVQEV